MSPFLEINMDLHLKVLNVILFVAAQLLMVSMSLGEKGSPHWYK